MKNAVWYSIIFILTVTFLTTVNLLGQPEKSTNAESYASQNDGTNTYVTGITSGRARSLVGGVLALTSVIVGWRLRSRSTHNRTWSLSAFVLGIVAILVSVIHLANNTGGFGTGGGKAGSIVAIALGLTGTFINGMALRLKKSG